MVVRLVLLLAIGLLAASGVRAQSPTLRPGDRYTETVPSDPSGPGRPRFVREWRLVIDGRKTVWVALETLDFIPDMSIERSDDPDRPVECEWDKLGFNEYLKLEDSLGTYRLRLQFEPRSRSTGTFVLRVSETAPDLPLGSARYEKSRDYYRRVLARPGVSDSPPFEVAAIEGLIDALELLEKWSEMVVPLNRAIAIYRKQGQDLEAARLLEERALVEENQKRLRDAVETAEEAVALRVREGDGYSAAMTLTWAYCVGSRTRGLLANRFRLERALRLARAEESPGHVLEDLAHELLDNERAGDALKVLGEARALHARAGDETSEVRVAELLFEQMVTAGRVDEAESLVTGIVERFRRQDKRKPAIILLNHVGEEALDRGRAEPAKRFIRTALDLVQGMDEPRVEALTRRSLANVFLALKRRREALAMSETAAALFEGLADPREEAAERVQLGFIQRELGNREAALASFRRATALAAGVGDRIIEGRAWNGRGCIHQDRREYAAALQAYDRAFALVGKNGERQLVRDLTRNRILVQQARADGEAAGRAAAEGIQALEALGDVEGMAETYLELGYSLNGLREFEDALAAFQKARATYARAGLERGVARALNEMGNTRSAKGEYAAAIRDYQAAYRIGRRAEDQELVVWALFNLGYSHAYLGQYAEAAEWFSRVVPHYKRESRGSVRFARFLIYVANTFKKAGRSAGGIPFARQAVSILGDPGKERARVRALLGLGDLCLNAGRRGAGLECFLDAVRVARPIPTMSTLLERALAGLGAALTPPF
jgi:tetratricopeptide (TPR) repeat protein